MNINSSDLPNFIYLSFLLIFLASSVVLKSHLKISELARQALMWLIIILFILTIYSFRHDFYKLKNRVASELFPSKIVRVDGKTIAVAVANDSHFYIDLKINSEMIHFMVDTGASDVTLNLSDAKKVGIDVNNLLSFKKYQTANGTIISGVATVDQIEIAGIKFDNVSVSINNSDMGTSLLGMSFLQKFEKYEFYQDKLILTTGQ